MRRRTSPARSHNRSKVPTWSRLTVRACNNNRSSMKWWLISWRWSSVARHKQPIAQSLRAPISIDLTLANGPLLGAILQIKTRKIVTCTLISAKKSCWWQIQTIISNKRDQRLPRWRNNHQWWWMMMFYLSNRDRGSEGVRTKIATTNLISKSSDKISAIKS